MIESWGRGIDRIMVLCEKNGISALKLSDESSGLGLNSGWIPNRLSSPGSKSGNK
ncbi:MAG: hypothetical protein KBH12_02390 [Synergistaceae bacterium]|nr:hypothetical protein [Synergistaceae bacterium]MBP9627093.1 hypothetical protein [Synergistaceae bacterium]